MLKSSTSHSQARTAKGIKRGSNITCGFFLMKFYPHIENPLVRYRKKLPKPPIKDRESPALWDLAFVIGTDSEKEAIKS
ncbi:hypothetical protein QQF64_008837 [Cirrhinus molitorella]|uniref:Uncharacterized protein n=1 Tax=Cirrhinus molitorella TaxID=172907 RepID=A0ABR3M8P5_9TELE